MGTKSRHNLKIINGLVKCTNCGVVKGRVTPLEPQPNKNESTAKLNNS